MAQEVHCVRTSIFPLPGVLRAFSPYSFFCGPSVTAVPLILVLGMEKEKRKGQETCLLVRKPKAFPKTYPANLGSHLIDCNQDEGERPVNYPTAYAMSTNRVAVRIDQPTC